MADLSYLVAKTFKKEDVISGSKKLTIKDVVVETVGQGEQAEDKPAIYFVEDPRFLVLNQTKYNYLSDVFGSRDVDTWKGGKVTLMYDPNVTLRGKRVGGIALEATKP